MNNKLSDGDEDNDYCVASHVATLIVECRALITNRGLGSITI